METIKLSEHDRFLIIKWRANATKERIIAERRENEGDYEAADEAMKCARQWDDAADELESTGHYTIKE